MLWRIRTFSTIATLLLVTALSLAQGTERDLRPRTASISGRVTIEGEPAANLSLSAMENPKGALKVKIYSLGGRDFVAPYIFTAATDEEGRYRIDGLPPGTYQISPAAAAYVRQNKFPGIDAVATVTLEAGEAREKVDFALSRGGAITGRVTDEEGRPQVDRYVRLIDVSDPSRKRDVTEATRNTIVTDDRGIYRIFGLPKGRYIAYTGGERDTLRGAISGKKTQITYHPDALSQDGATVIDVANGKEVAGVDIRLRNPVKSYSVSGRVIVSETRAPLMPVNVYCFRIEHPGQQSGNWEAWAITGVDGSFTLRGVKPGNYKAGFSPPHESGDYYSEGAYFEVGDEDVDGVEVLALRGATVSGRVIVEEDAASARTPLPQLFLSVEIWRERFTGATRMQTTVGRRQIILGADRAFRLTGMQPGKARLSIQTSINDPIHLLRVERGGNDVTDGFEVGPAERIEDVRVIAGRGDGRILGTLKIIGGTLPPGVTLSVQVEREGLPRLGRASEVDEKGRFSITGLLPGEYGFFVYWGTKNHIPLDPNFKVPPPSKQRLSVVNGAETPLNVTIDLSRKEQEKQ